LETEHTHAEWIPYEPSETNSSSTWLLDELSDNNVSDDGLSLAIRPLQNYMYSLPFVTVQIFTLLAALLLVILTDVILMVYQINVC